MGVFRVVWVPKTFKLNFRYKKNVSMIPGYLYMPSVHISKGRDTYIGTRYCMDTCRYIFSDFKPIIS